MTAARRTYSFCRSFRSLKVWAGSSVIILLDRSLLVTVKTQNITSEINDTVITLHNYHPI